MPKLNTKGGRPLKQTHEKRSEQVKTRYTLAELDKLRADASRAGLSLADFVRRASLGMAITIKHGGAEPAALTELNKIGINLNQIARSLNRGQDVPHYLEQAIAKLDETLDQVAEAYVR
ncbi:MAG: plasmid mobilization relaxosome protein MobC [Hyphomicrobium sp.]